MQEKPHSRKRKELMSQIGHANCVRKGRRGPWFVAEGSTPFVRGLPPWALSGNPRFQRRRRRRRSSGCFSQAVVHDMSAGATPTLLHTCGRAAPERLRGRRLANLRR